MLIGINKLMGPQANRSCTNKQPWLIIHGNGQLECRRMSSIVSLKASFKHSEASLKKLGGDLRSQVILNHFTSHPLPPTNQTYGSRHYQNPLFGFSVKDIKVPQKRTGS